MDFEGLERLGRLRASGAIGEDEFEAEKRRILGRPSGRPFQTIEPVSDLPPDASEEEGDRVSATSSARRNVIISLCAVVAVLVGGAIFYGYTKSSKTPVSAFRYSVRSKISGLHISRPKSLSDNPNRVIEKCDGLDVAPTTSPSKNLLSSGWHVTGEQNLNGLDITSFSGSCFRDVGGRISSIDGNIAIYNGADLKAVIYGPKVGKLLREDGNGGVRIENAKTGGVLGTILIDSKSIIVQK